MLCKKKTSGFFEWTSKAVCQIAYVSFGWIVSRMKANQALSPLFRFSVAVILIFGLFSAVSAGAQVPRSSHVVLVIEENTSFNTTIANMPWLVAQGNANGYATTFISDTSRSLMDYLWLISRRCHSSPDCTLPAWTPDF